MATQAIHTPIYSMPIMKNSYNEKIDITDGTTWVTAPAFYEGTFYPLNKKYFSDNIIELQNNSKFFIKKLQNIINEYQLLHDFFPNITKQILINRLQPTLAIFMNVKSDIFSVELTKDESIFFTLKKNDLIFYIEQYLEKDNNSEEFVITAFKNNQAAINKSGNIGDIVTIMNSLSVNN